MFTTHHRRWIAGWVQSARFSLRFTASAWRKPSGAPPVVEVMEAWGLGEQRLLIGTGELVRALLQPLYRRLPRSAFCS